MTMMPEAEQSVMEAVRPLEALWHPSPSRSENVYVAFRSTFEDDADKRVKLQLLGCTFYRCYMDGEEVLQGPARYDALHPEADELELELDAGRHTLLVVVHYIGVQTRFCASDIPPFFWCREASDALQLEWSCKELTAFAHAWRRINPQLGWIESRDTRLLADWAAMAAGQSFEVGTDGGSADRPDQDGWVTPVGVTVPLGELRSVRGFPMPLAVRQGEWLAKGTYADRFGYADDDPPVRFLLRELRAAGDRGANGTAVEIANRTADEATWATNGSDGVWYRFDMGSVGLYFPSIVICAPAGSVVEAAYAESLLDGRVAPFITLSAGTSCHLDRWRTNGEKQTLRTFSPRGYRFVELHVEANAHEVEVFAVNGSIRTSLRQVTGSFRCDDERLNAVWTMGLRTLEACCEDALVDTPVRERGQWLGDAVAVGLETIGVTTGQYDLIRRSLRQAAQDSRGDGLVSALYPGRQQAWIGSYGLLWISGCMTYYRHTGDRALLEELYPAAVRNMEAFACHWTPLGLSGMNVWDFLDWGHTVPRDTVHVSISLMLYGAFRDLAEWSRLLGRDSASAGYEAWLDIIRDVVDSSYRTSEGLLTGFVSAENDERSARSPDYHATVLGLYYELIESDSREAAVAFIKDHLLRCFPNEPKAPRLRHPGIADARLITPYFLHFTLDALLRNGEARFVLDQYRTCWGWMLDQGATTTLEVFDTGWSHCHAWSAAPTWQLSRHVLGLQPAGDGNPRSLVWSPKPGGLRETSGTIPLSGGGVVGIEYARREDHGVFTLNSDVLLIVALDPSVTVRSLTSDGVLLDREGRLSVHEVRSLRIELVID